MKVCSVCSGKGCERCNFEGVDFEVTFTRKNISSRKKLSYDDYQKKKQRDFKIDKKNAREEQ